MIQARKITAGLLTGEQSGALAQMKFIAHANDVFNTRAQTIGDEVGIAGMDKRLLEIVIARRRGILDGAFANIDNAPSRVFRVGLHAVNFIGIHSIFQSGERNHGFEN